MRVAALALLLLLVPSLASAAPTVRGVATTKCQTTGACANMAVPASSAVGDLLLMFCESDEALTVANIGNGTTDWTAPLLETAGIAVFARVAVAGDVDGTCEACDVADVTNHTLCRIMGITTGTYNSADPFDVFDYAGPTGATTTIPFDGEAATNADTLVILAAGGNDDGSGDDETTDGSTVTASGGTTFSGFTNSNLTSITEQIDNSTTIGNDGSLGVATGVWASSGDWGASTATGPSLSWTTVAFNINPVPPTATHTFTQTRTSTNTPTVTNTPTPTAQNLCGWHSFAISASGDDGYTQSVANGAASLTTNGTADAIGKFVFGVAIERLGLFRFDTSSLDDDAIRMQAILDLNITAKTDLGGARNLLGNWSTSNPWTTADHEDTLSVGTALPPTDIGTIKVVNRYSFPLLSPSNVSTTGTTGIKVGVTGGDPTVSDDGTITVEMLDHASSNHPILRVYACSPTPTRTPSNTATDTPTVTPTFPTPTWTVGPKVNRCPDRNGDDLCGIAFAGDLKNQPLLDVVKWTYRDADMICSYLDATKNSADVRREQEELATPGPGQGRCAPFGTIIAGIPCDEDADCDGAGECAAEGFCDIFTDLVLVDIGPIKEWKDTRTGPREGICHGPNTDCRITHPLGLWDLDPAGNMRCIHGNDLGNDCSVTPCAADPDPGGDASWCQPNVYRESDDVGVVGCPEPYLCQERARVQASYQNLQRTVRALEDSGRIPILIMPYAAASYQAGTQTGFSAASIPLCGIPDGSKTPYDDCQAAWEVGEREIAMLGKWAHEFVDRYDRGLKAWVDLAQAARYFTGGKPWKILGDQTLVSFEGQGHCTCLTDEDCGEGGDCVDSKYCAAGTRSSCERDPQCWGANSQPKPGLAWCIDEGRWYLAQTIVEGCLHDRPTSEQDFWITEGLADCRDPRIPANPLFPTWPPATNTATVTFTATATNTVPTATHTDGPSPTHSQTFTPAPHTPTPTPEWLRGTDDLYDPEPGILGLCGKKGVNGNTNAAGKLGAQLARFAGHWADRLDDPPNDYGGSTTYYYDYRAHTALEVHIGLGAYQPTGDRNASGYPTEAVAEGWVLDLGDATPLIPGVQHIFTGGDLVCGDPVTVGGCTKDLSGPSSDIGHCVDNKFGTKVANGVTCTLKDLDLVRQWMGPSAELPLTWRCSNDGMRACQSDGDCPSPATNPPFTVESSPTCVKTGDFFRYSHCNDPPVPDPRQLCSTDADCRDTAYYTLADPYNYVPPLKFPGVPGTRCTKFCTGNDERPCTVNGDCTGEGTCSAQGHCDAPPYGYIEKPARSGNVCYAAACTWFAEMFIIPQIDDTLLKLRTHQREDSAAPACVTDADCDTSPGTGPSCNSGVCGLTVDCARDVWHQLLRDSLSGIIELGCTGDCVNNPHLPCTIDTDCPDGDTCGPVSPDCVRELNACMRDWRTHDSCGSTNTGGCEYNPDLLDQGLTDAGCPLTPSECDAQISCSTYFAWCQSVIERFNPVRFGARMRPGGLAP